MPEVTQKPEVTQNPHIPSTIVTAFHLCTFWRLTFVCHHSLSFMYFLAFDFSLLS
jgi:hypothetical protein